MDQLCLKFSETLNVERPFPPFVPFYRGLKNPELSWYTNVRITSRSVDLFLLWEEIHSFVWTENNNQLLHTILAARVPFNSSGSRVLFAKNTQPEHVAQRRTTQTYLHSIWLIKIASYRRYLSHQLPVSQVCGTKEIQQLRKNKQKNKKVPTHRVITCFHRGWLGLHRTRECLSVVESGGLRLNVVGYASTSKITSKSIKIPQNPPKSLYIYTKYFCHYFIKSTKNNSTQPEQAATESLKYPPNPSKSTKIISIHT